MEHLGETFDQTSLTRIFELNEDRPVTLKVLPTGPDMDAHAMSTQLFRAAEQSGVSLRPPPISPRKMAVS
jgi:hypothetical protein